MRSARASTPGPDSTLAQNDPGDETARRYQFQYHWAAITCCALLDDTEDVMEVFCEHHEDVLIKHRDGKFTGHQVKTRESDQPLWKTGDDQVLAAFSRFVQLEAEFPNHFRAFGFLTGHPLHVANNAQSIGFVLRALSHAQATSDLPSTVLKWLARIADRVGQPESLAFQALKKAFARDGLPKLGDVLAKLITTLTSCWSTASECSYDSVKCAAIALVEECARASSLHHEQLLPAYLITLNQPSPETVARIDGKRMTLERVQAVLDNGFHSTATLIGDPSRYSEPGQGSADLLFRKLDAGGFSAVSQNSAEDLRDKSDYLGITWTKKFGRSKGLERYEHIRSTTLSDSSRAYEATKKENGKFGSEMREEMRRRFQERRANGDQLFDCSDDHLEGIAYSLTAQCKVQWSIDRPWERD